MIISTFENVPGETRKERTTKWECYSLRARTEKDGTTGAEGRQEGGGKRQSSPSAALSSRMPPGKLLTVRTFRETPVTLESLLVPSLLAICPPQEAAAVLQVRPEIHILRSTFLAASHSRTIFFFPRFSRALGRLFLRDSSEGKKKRTRPG